MKQIKDTNETKTLFDKLESMPLQGNFIRTNKYALELEKQIQSLKDEIERLKDNALKENEVIIRLTRERDEFIDRMIKAEIALGKQATLWEKELSEANATIQSMKDEK